MQADVPGLSTPGRVFGLRVTDVESICEPDQQDELVAFCQEFGFNRLIVETGVVEGSGYGG